ncbi:unnamed protein product [Closterium sp. NIES-53]
MKRLFGNPSSPAAFGIVGAGESRQRSRADTTPKYLLIGLGPDQFMRPSNSQLEDVHEDPFAELSLDPLADVSPADADVAVPKGAAPRPAGRRTLCDRCQRPSRACLCPSLPPSILKTRTRVIVLQHPHEAKKRLATAPILALTLESTCIITGRRFLEGSSAELDRVLIPRCGNRLHATWQDGRGGGEKKVERGGEENGQCAKEDRERGNVWNDGSEPLKRETAGIGREDADSGPTGDGVCEARIRGASGAGDGVCEARIRGASGAGDGVCVCGHVRLLMFPGEGALPVGDWWRWYLARRQLDAQHPGERGVEQHGEEQHGVEQHGEERRCRERRGECGEEKGCGELGGECGEEDKGRGEWARKCSAEAHGCEEWGAECGEGYAVTLVVIDGTWEHAKEMMKASGSFLRRYCALVRVKGNGVCMGVKGREASSAGEKGRESGGAGLVRRDRVG